MKVYVVIADYGLNGAGVLGVFSGPPPDALVRELELTDFPDGPYPPSGVTGYGGIEVEAFDVLDVP